MKYPIISQVILPTNQEISALDAVTKNSFQKVPANVEGDYVSLLSRGGLLISSPGLSDAFARGFALLDASTDVIRRSKVPSRKAGTLY